MTLPDLSPGIWALLIVLIIVQVGLLLAGLITVLRTPAERLTAPRIVWALICFVQFVGPILFFAIGRKPKPAETPGAPTDGAPVIQRVIDELYGSRS